MIRRISMIVTCLSLAPLVSGCDSTKLGAADQQRLTDQFYQYLKSKTFRANGAVSCSETFDLGPARLLDATSSGDTGKLRIAVEVTYKGPYRYYLGRYPAIHHPGAVCYGAPPNGWDNGQISTSRYEVLVERWDSGWRIKQPQDFQLF
ncbi:hypothetical protein P1X14_03400 [Sphingomonas sp. AOB5]|uniref:hypothetical protein n=1 Tax=Sphingomonas sp. AOB5 TaxID=3034017 RepID=UPI0023F80825|nr:hypothetical protein [Sphingomonas sp. AOB5]MDF7774284.1 hypothetical protein [Sphingomonas sp. AOB5]